MGPCNHSCMACTRSPRWRFALRAFVATLLAASCRQDAVVGPGNGPPYLAVVVLVDAPPEVTSRGPYLFHVRELSGTLHIDTTFRASPRDTVVFSVPAATYRVDIGDVPATC